MGARVIVEVLGVRGRARLRVPLPTLPASIGRALDCDVIVDDPQISGHHARVEQDDAGGLWLVDLDSTNGTFRVADSARVTRLALEHEERLRLGNTVVRVRLTTDPIERTQVSPLLSAPLVSLVQRKRVVFTLLATVAAFTACSAYLSTYGREQLAAVLGATLLLLLLLIAWSVGWAVASRMVVGRFRFFGHLASVAIALLGVEFWDLGCNLGCYAVAAEHLAASLSMVGDLLIATWLLYMHLRLASSFRPRRLLRVALGLVLTLALVAGVIERLNRPDFSNALSFSQKLWPPAFHLSAPSSVDTFMGELEGVRERADALAAE